MKPYTSAELKLQLASVDPIREPKLYGDLVTELIEATQLERGDLYRRYGIPLNDEGAYRRDDDQGAS